MWMNLRRVMSCQRTENGWLGQLRIPWLLAWLVAGTALTCRGGTSDRPLKTPNVVVIYCDDMGWGDLGCYGARQIRTPNLDRLARQGTRFTSFYVSQPVCSASRASLLTGCYANRIGIHGALFPGSKIGISSNEVTLAEIAKSRGYATAIFGKWHLGHAREFLPLRHGFDEYLGLPYSNDMWPNNPSAKSGTYPPLPLIDGERVVEEQPDQSQLTRRYTERAVQFIERNVRRPFFLYVPHSMPHVPIFASARFKGRSKAGLYGDVIEEIDASVGEILDALRRHRLEDNTLVVFTSDNGPWGVYGNHAGSSGPFRECKGTVYEGGVRVPCIVRWPGQVPAGRVSDIPWMTIDLLPTVARQLGVALPTNPIDGRDANAVLRGEPGARSPHDAFYFYYRQGELQAVRSDQWKLILPHLVDSQVGGRDGQRGVYRPFRAGLELYDLSVDPGERVNLASQKPEVLTRLLLHAEAARQELGDSLTRRVGVANREPGRIP